jgi:hypothetical protein
VMTTPSPKDYTIPGVVQRCLTTLRGSGRRKLFQLYTNV